jgi:K+/H+ antiporter YhaU regulatory subunit KhtT
MNSINVYEQPLPGLGQQFELHIDDRHILCVIALRDGRRQLAQRLAGEDATNMLIDLDRDQAATVGALLLGAQFTIAAAVDAEPDDQVIVDTITIPHESPAIGRSAVEFLGEFADDVVVLAVIRDHTRDIVENDPDLALGDGDRVAIAMRRRQHQAITQALTGSAPPTVTPQ